ncbi:Di-copper centre-containing protein [Mycena sanguinolenta]|nr:Di-copper centre-containing protein [Mycena sanguinolenta]
MAEKLLIAGAPRFGDQASPRLELADFVRNEKQFSLYIQALQEIYAHSQHRVASYFQIGGIHGRPYVDWNQSPRDRNSGYCVHGTSLFATWHRPYVVLVEQEVQKIALAIAKEYSSDHDAWIAAANSLRQPYWGWNTGATLTPPDAVIANQEVNIMIPPAAELLAVSNPFFQYKFPDATNMGAMTPCPFHHHTTQVTTRNPDSQGRSNTEQLKLILGGPIGRQIVQLAEDLNSATKWLEFTKALEYVHGVVHDVVGGLGNNGIPSGHMGWVPYAGFDPIFWAHHAQVDRLIQIWSDQHNQQWEPSQAGAISTPFWKFQTTYWKSDDIVNTDATFNYNYPPNMSTVSKPSSAEGGEGGRWSAHVSAKKFELRGSYTVFVFLGGVPADSKEWLKDPPLAGIFSVFANSTPEECANCRDQDALVIDSFVHLNDALKAAGLTSLEEAEVKPFLTNTANLNWGVSTADGRILRSNDLLAHFPSLKIEIVQTIDAPIDGRYKSYPDITRGRPGGYRDD